MLAVERVSFDDQVGNLLVVIYNLNSFLNAFAHLFVAQSVSSDIGLLKLHEKCSDQICYSGKWHILDLLCGNVTIFHQEVLRLFQRQSLY